MKDTFTAHECADAFAEANGAQILAVEGLQRVGIPCQPVKNVTNKHARITGTLKPVFDRVFFHESLLTPEGELSEEVPVTFLSQVAEYVEGAAHDDAPDALAGLVASFLTDGANVDDLNEFYNVLENL